MQLTGDHSTPITCTYWNELMSSFSDPPLCEGLIRQHHPPCQMLNPWRYSDKAETVALEQLHLHHKITQLSTSTRQKNMEFSGS